MANQSSGMGRGRKLVEELVAQLRHRGLRAEVAWTPEERSSLVNRAASGDGSCRCLVAVGGDGTVSALLNERPLRPVTVLPAGTENLVARHFGLRGDPRRLAGTIASGRSVPVDVGQAAGRRFLLMTGFGFDAEVVSRHHRSRVSHSGSVRPTHRIAYVEPILRSSFTYRFPAISVRIDDPGAEEVLRGTTVFVFNLPRYALGLPFVPITREDDGWLDLIVFRNPGPFQAFYYLCKVVCGIHLNDPGVFHRRVRRVAVTADEPIPVQIDGDPGGYLLPSGSDHPDHRRRNGSGRPSPLVGPPDQVHPTEWNIEILPSALKILTHVSH
ncbi:MAG: diacylglycerol/lipid kinase family protein [Isosphaeraceae bacterium]